MAYIEKEKLMELSQDITTFNYETKSFGCFSGVSDEDIAKTPVADVVEVVRCKDCKHATFYSCKNDACYKRIICEYEIGTDDENFYCIYGEARTPKEEVNEHDRA